jgi:hypothetical protein
MDSNIFISNIEKHVAVNGERRSLSIKFEDDQARIVSWMCSLLVVSSAVAAETRNEKNKRTGSE